MLYVRYYIKNYTENKKIDIFIVNICRWFIFMDSIFENIHSMYHIN